MTFDPEQAMRDERICPRCGFAMQAHETAPFCVECMTPKRIERKAVAVMERTPERACPCCGAELGPNEPIDLCERCREDSACCTLCGEKTDGRRCRCQD